MVGLLPLPSIINRIMRVTFFSRSDNNDEIHGWAWNVIKYIMEGTKFDIMALMTREIAMSKGGKGKNIYCAPYTVKVNLDKIDFDVARGVVHKEYRPRDVPSPLVPPHEP